MDPKELSSHLKNIADGIDASKAPSRERVAAVLRDTIAAVERNKDKAKKKKINKKDVDSSTAASMHMGLLEKYRDFHDTGENLLGFRNVVIDGIPENSPNDVVAAQKECTKAFNDLDVALRNARSAYSHLMASLAKY